MAIERSGDGFDVSVAPDGTSALDYLHGRGQFVGAPAPDLVLLDLNLPRMTGLAVLRQLRPSPSWAHLPIVVLTTSDTQSDALASYKAGGNCFVTKPLNPDRYMATVAQLVRYYRRLCGNRG